MICCFPFTLSHRLPDIRHFYFASIFGSSLEICRFLVFLLHFVHFVDNVSHRNLVAPQFVEFSFGGLVPFDSVVGQFACSPFVGGTAEERD